MGEERRRQERTNALEGAYRLGGRGAVAELLTPGVPERCPSCWGKTLVVAENMRKPDRPELDQAHEACRLCSARGRVMLRDRLPGSTFAPGVVGVGRRYDDKFTYVSGEVVGEEEAWR